MIHHWGGIVHMSIITNLLTLISSVVSLTDWSCYSKVGSSPKYIKLQNYEKDREIRIAVKNVS